MNNRHQVRIRYDEKTDSFDLEISTDAGKTWGLSMSAKCRPLHDNGTADFIHYSLIMELKRAIDLGYRMVN